MPEQDQVYVNRMLSACIVVSVQFVTVRAAKVLKLLKHRNDEYDMQ